MNVKIRYTSMGGLYIKPSDIAKSKFGSKLIADNYNSKLAKSIRHINQQENKMNELRFGHRVIAWDDDKSKAVKGRYIYNGNGAAFPHCVLVRESNTHEPFNYCELDLEADEFLIGDEVEFSDSKDFKECVNGVYGGYRPESNYPHRMKYNCSFQYCRYPRKEKDEANNELDIHKITNWLSNKGYKYNIIIEEDGFGAEGYMSLDNE